MNGITDVTNKKSDKSSGNSKVNNEKSEVTSKCSELDELEMMLTLSPHTKQPSLQNIDVMQSNQNSNSLTLRNATSVHRNTSEQLTSRRSISQCIQLFATKGSLPFQESTEMMEEGKQVDNSTNITGCLSPKMGCQTAHNLKSLQTPMVQSSTKQFGNNTPVNQLAANQCDKATPANYSVVNQSVKTTPVSQSTCKDCTKTNPVNQSTIHHETTPVDQPTLSGTAKNTPVNQSAINQCSKTVINQQTSTETIPVNQSTSNSSASVALVNQRSVSQCAKTSPLNQTASRDSVKITPLNKTKVSHTVQFTPVTPSTVGQSANFKIFCDNTPVFKRPNTVQGSCVSNTKLKDVTNRQPVQKPTSAIKNTSNCTTPIQRTLEGCFKAQGMKTPINNQKSNQSFFKTPSNFVSNPSGMKRTPPLCDCGRRSNRKMVQTPGPNVGRFFYACPLGRKGPQKKSGCGYFKWEQQINAKCSPTLPQTCRGSFANSVLSSKATPVTNSVSLSSNRTSIANSSSTSGKQTAFGNSIPSTKKTPITNSLYSKPMPITKSVSSAGMLPKPYTNSVSSSSKTTPHLLTGTSYSSYSYKSPLPQPDFNTPITERVFSMNESGTRKTLGVASGRANTVLKPPLF